MQSNDANAFDVKSVNIKYLNQKKNFFLVRISKWSHHGGFRNYRKVLNVRRHNFKGDLIISNTAWVPHNNMVVPYSFEPIGRGILDILYVN